MRLAPPRVGASGKTSNVPLTAVTPPQAQACSATAERQASMPKPSPAERRRSYRLPSDRSSLPSMRSLHSFMVVMVVAGLAATTSVSISMMQAEIGRTRSERLSAQLATASRALVATLEQRLKGVLDTQNSTAYELSVDPALAEPYPAIADMTPNNRLPMLSKNQHFLGRMLSVIFTRPDVQFFGFIHPNGRWHAFGSLFGRASGLWEYLESTPSTYFHGIPLGQPSAEDVATQFDIPCVESVTCLGEPDTRRALDDFLALDDSQDWGAVEQTTGHSLGKMELLGDGTLIDHTTCGDEFRPTVLYSPYWDHDPVQHSAVVSSTLVVPWQAALANGCTIPYEGVWAYNETGAQELRETLANAYMGLNGSVLAAGAYNASDAEVGAWTFSYLYGSEAFAKQWRRSFRYLAFSGMPFFKDKSDGGVIEHSVAGDYGWFGPRVYGESIFLTAVTTVHSYVDANGSALSGGASTFAGTVYTDIRPEIISVFLREYITKLEVPEESKSQTVAFVVTGSASEPGVMVAASTVASETISNFDDLDEEDDGQSSGNTTRRRMAERRNLVHQHVALIQDPAVYKCDLSCDCNCVPALMNESAHPLIAEAALDLSRSSFSVGGKRFLMRTSDFDSLRLKLLVGVIVPEEPYTEGSRVRTRLVVTIVVGIALGVLLIWSFVQHALVVRPLAEVSRGIKAMGDMRLDEAARLTPRTSSVITTIDSLLGGFHEARRHLLAWRAQETSRRVTLEAEKAARNLESVGEAQANASQLTHPMVLVSASTFIGLGKLTPYETLRGAGKLIFLDTLEQLVAFKQKNKVIFLSHQWLGWHAPDPVGVHYAAMVSAAREAIAMLLPGVPAEAAQEDVYIWVDFGSIAQEHRGMQVMAISSLPVYSAHSDAFIVIAPSAVHAQTQMMCDLGTYVTRGWCRAEMLSKVCGSGLHHMYVFEGGGEGAGAPRLEPVTLEYLTKLSLHVFSGQFSCCALNHVNCKRCDKQELVTPVLGLYSLVLTRRAEPHMAEIAQLIERDKEQFFPSHIDFRFGLEGEYVERRPLFDDLIEIMEEYIGGGKKKKAATSSVGCNSNSTSGVSSSSRRSSGATTNLARKLPWGSRRSSNATPKAPVQAWTADDDEESGKKAGA